MQHPQLCPKPEPILIHAESIGRDPKPRAQQPLLKGSWVVISGVLGRVTISITHNKGLITPLIL